MVAAALVVAPLMTAGATAAEPLEDGVGQTLPWTSETNHEDYWEDLYADHSAVCYKVEGANSSAHGTVSENKLTVTLKPFDPAWGADRHWELLVIKAGSDSNFVVRHPVAGVAYASPSNGNNDAEVSHWIVCKGTAPKPPVIVKPNLTIDCDAEGYITRSENVDWTPEVHDDGTTTWTARPILGTVFEEGVKVSWDVPSLEKLAEECEPSEQPEQPEPVKSESSKTTFDCASTTATVTTTTTTTPFVWDESTEKWVPGTPSSADVVNTRPLTQDELGDCPLVPGEIQSVCVGDVPYLGYQVTLPEGFVPDSANPVTITFVNPDGEDYVVADQPLSGALLWPGASDGEPKMWPGWDLVDGEYVETDGNFAWTRAGVTVEFDVNPTYTTVVEYPQAAALCANPPVGDDDPTTGTPTSTDAEALAVTGGGINPIVVAAGGAALVAGIAVVTIAAYRRRHASMQ
ncbi:hypothetical protein B1729_02800 [Microbacterium sp. B35-04]|nr:hypothetical protein B1729_02800 [Microbacterium sp. B35-04]